MTQKLFTKKFEEFEAEFWNINFNKLILQHN